MLRSEQNEYAHAFVLWFDIEFTHCHKPIYFGTGPQHRYTHWKQAVFYVNDVFAISAGEEVRGHLSCKVCNVWGSGWPEMKYIWDGMAYDCILCNSAG